MKHVLSTNGSRIDESSAVLKIEVVLTTVTAAYVGLQ